MSRPLARGNSDFLMDRAMTKAAKHLPLAFGEVAQFARPVSFYIRESLSLAAVVVAVVTVILIVGGF